MFLSFSLTPTTPSTSYQSYTTRALVRAILLERPPYTSDSLKRLRKMQEESTLKAINAPLTYLSVSLFETFR